MVLRNPVQALATLASLLLYACPRPASSFSPSVATFAARRQQFRSVASPATSSTAIGTASLTSPPSNAKTSTRETSDELLGLLRDKANSRSGANDDRINSLVRSLIASRSSFDPAKCIDGPLFASVHFIGDTPLWEKIGLGVRNVKGQKYTLGDGASGTFVNYAEIFGENFYLQAVGDCRDEGPVPQSSSGVVDGISGNPLEALASLFNPKQSALLPTPYDYSASVTGASIVLLQKFSLDLTIEGMGTVRVLYADENLRIFLSPTDTNVTRGGGDWESEGLVVVQVRVDLVYGDWIDRLQ